MNSIIHDDLNMKLCTVLIKLTERPGAYIGEVSLEKAEKFIKNLVSAIYIIYSVKLDFEDQFTAHVAIYYSEKYQINDPSWTKRSWKDIIYFFNYFDTRWDKFCVLLKTFINEKGFYENENRENEYISKVNGKKIMEYFLKDAEINPQKYMKDISLRSFCDILYSMMFALHTFSGEEIHEILNGFLEYVCIHYRKKYRISNEYIFGNRNWNSIIMLFSADDKEAFYTFYKLYNEFKKTYNTIL